MGDERLSQEVERLELELGAARSALVELAIVFGARIVELETEVAAIRKERRSFTKPKADVGAGEDDVVDELDSLPDDSPIIKRWAECLHEMDKRIRTPSDIRELFKLLVGMPEVTMVSYRHPAAPVMEEEMMNMLRGAMEDARAHEKRSQEDKDRDWLHFLERREKP